MTEICHDIRQAFFAYDRESVLTGISETFEKGRFYGILGPNGCGKTTLLDLMAGFIHPDTGDVRFMGKSLKQTPKKVLAKQISLVSQNFYINFPYRVSDVVMMGRYPYIPRFSSPSARDFQKCDQAMEITGVRRLKDQLVTEISGGERQRTVFARALAQDTDILLLDEATSNLDIHHSIHLLDTVKKKVRENGLTVISVFQDINLAAIFCDEMVFMKKGALIKKGPTQDLMTEELLETVFHIQSKIRFEPLYQAGQAVFKTGKATAW
jgi:ABC-type cobalamin/Fe3+-siderophores transport system ATPase subunit